MTTTTVYALEGFINSRTTAGAYSDAREGTGTLLLQFPVTSGLYTGQYGNPPGDSLFDVFQGFMSFDTSTIPDGDTITAAELSIWLTNVFASNAVWTLEARVHNWGPVTAAGGWVVGAVSLGGQAPTPTLETSDFVAGSSLASKTLVASKTEASMTDDAYNPLTESGTALRDAVNKSGLTQFMLSSDQQRLGVAPPGSGFQAGADFINYRSSSNPSRLVVTHS